MSKTIANVYSISQIIANNGRNGYYFFSKGAMRSFNSRIDDVVYGNCVFVTSERNDMPYSRPQPRVARFALPWRTVLSRPSALSVITQLVHKRTDKPNGSEMP